MFRRLLVPIDIAEESSWRRALPPAAELARLGGGNLAVLTVVPDLDAMLAGAYDTSLLEHLMAQARHRLAEIVAASAINDLPVRQVVRQGTIYAEILAEAQQTDVDLIVMTSHRPAMRDYLIGPNAARVVRHATCSVLVVRHTPAAVSEPPD